MKKTNIIILFIFATVKLSAINVIISDNTILTYAGWNKEDNPSEWVQQYIIPIEKDGVNLNKLIEFTVTGVNSNLGLRIRNYLTRSIFASYIFSGTSGTFTFDATTAESTLYIFEFYTVSNNNVFTVFYPGTTKPANFYFVTERSKTGTFTNSPTNYKYKINWVDYWLNNHANPTQFKIDAEEALKFSWQKQVFLYGKQPILIFNLNYPITFYTCTVA